MGARSWSSAPSVPSSHHHHHSSSATSSSLAGGASGAITTATTTTTTGPLFSSSSPSSSLSSSPSSSPPSSSSPSPTGGKKHRHHHLQQQQQQQQPTSKLRPADRHAFFRIPAGDNKRLETPQSVATAKAAAAAAAQRAERNLSVKRDLALDLPPSPALPDGEERPYGSSIRLRIRDHDQESEIYRECIRPPPNRTVHETPTSFPPFRCNSESILTDPSMPAGRMKPSGSALTTTNSSPSSILAVCCTASSTSLSSSGSSSGGYGYRNMSHHYHHHQPAVVSSVAANRAVSAASSDKDHSSRLLLDIHGQPIVTRSKSMSTGSSLQQPDSYLTVMVPPCPPPAKTLEAAVKSYVRSLRERVHKPTSTSSSNNINIITTPSIPVPVPVAVVVGVDNAGYTSTRRRPSCCHHADQPPSTTHQETEPSSSSRSKLANLPVVSCASASTTPSQLDGT